MNTRQKITLALAALTMGLPIGLPCAAAHPKPAEPTPFVKELVRVAREQFDTYHTMRETAPKLTTQIRAYWTDIGFSFPGTKTAWSAVFVSWCVKKAGATKTEFHFAPAHSIFVNAAIQNAVANRGVFRGHDIKTYAPKVGDIIQNNRLGSKFDFAYAKSHANYFSHSAIVVEEGRNAKGNRFAVTIGGNEADSVGRKTIALNADGKIVPRTKDPFICVIETLK